MGRGIDDPLSSRRGLSHQVGTQHHGIEFTLLQRIDSNLGGAHDRRAVQVEAGIQQAPHTGLGLEGTDEVAVGRVEFVDQLRANGLIEWVVVRPDSLIDVGQVTAYELHPSPTRSAIFDPGKTSRINVGHFMADLITNDDTWQQWQGQMPVIYNKAE